MKLPEIEERLKSAIEKEGSEFTAIFIPEHITLKIHTSKRHFWSPQLSLTLEKDEDKTLIRGLYGPNPTIWALFFFGYSSLGIIILFAGMVALSQWMLKIPGIFGWITLMASILLLLLYIFAQTGQKIGAAQMFDLHHFYEETIGKRTNIS